MRVLHRNQHRIMPGEVDAVDQVACQGKVRAFWNLITFTAKYFGLCAGRFDCCLEDRAGQPGEPAQVLQRQVNISVSVEIIDLVENVILWESNNVTALVLSNPIAELSKRTPHWVSRTSISERSSPTPTTTRRH